MKVRLLRDQKIQHKAGEIVEVSPVVYDFLISTSSAEPVMAEAAKAEPVKAETAKTTRKRK